MTREKEMKIALLRSQQQVKTAGKGTPIKLRLREQYLHAIYKQKCDARDGTGHWAANIAKATSYLKELKKRTLQRSITKIKQESPKHLQQLLLTEPIRNVCAIEELVELIDHPDTLFASRVMTGFNAIANSDVTGVWQPNDKPMIEEAEVKQFYNRTINLRKSKPGLDDELLIAIVKIIENDVEKGRYKEITKKDLQCQPAIAFPKDESTEQRKKIRLLIDNRAKNEYCRSVEKLELHGTRKMQDLIGIYRTPTGQENSFFTSPLGQTKKETAQEVDAELKAAKDAHDAPEPQESLEQLAQKLSAEVSSLNQAMPPPTNPPPEMASDDVSEAYYLFGIDDPTSCPITGYDPRVAAFRYWISYTLNMGAEPSVPAFCRLSELLMAIAIYFGLPMLAYIDDQNYFGVTTLQIELAKLFVHALADTLGLPLSDKPSADQSSAKSKDVKALGIMYCYERQALRTRLTLKLPESFYKKFKEATQLLVEQIRTKSMTLKQVQIVLGLATFGTQHKLHKMGTELLRPLYKWLRDDLFPHLIRQKSERSHLRINVLALQQLLPLLPEVVYDNDDRPMTQSLLSTDASTDGGPNGEPMLGAYYVRSDGRREGFAVVVNRKQIEQLVGNEIRIEILEAMATYLAVRTWATPGDLMHTNIDNITQLYAQVKMTAKSACLLHIVTNMTSFAALKQQRIYYRYVKTFFNIADVFTRHEYAHIRNSLVQGMVTPPFVDWKDVLKRTHPIEPQLLEVTDNSPDTRHVSVSHPPTLSCDSRKRRKLC